MYDILIKNVRVVDPINGIDKVTDLAIVGGKIALIEDDITLSKSREVYDFTGKILISGLIDTHVHLGSMWGSHFGQFMLAKAGVTTCLDLAGPIDDIIGSIKDYGAGLNIASLQYASPPYTFATSNPSKLEIETLIDESLSKGSLGVKLLGGHYPLLPSVSETLINTATDKGAYVAWHAGSTETGSNINGMIEAVQIAGKNFLHLPHINSYCRGAVHSEMKEVSMAIDLLKSSRNIYSESYISPMNGTRLTCENDIPISHVTQNCLKRFGYDATSDGIKRAFIDCRVNAVVEVGNESVLLTGDEGLNAWLEVGSNIGGSFAVNPPVARMALVSAKDDDDRFIVDAISTDGGCIPRNVLVSKGMPLVKLDILSLNEYIIKASYNPSRLLRLKNKGHLSIGADADITIIDYNLDKAVASFVDGKLIMYEGLVVGRGANIICTKKGEKSIKAEGLKSIIVEPSLKPLTMWNGR